ncbi:hypothetical protein B0G57_12853 [Trinickia symbiotica]|uniref:Uncharacterized protein n=1 Tax=Trinickia symbiotica TaxID=863227 RepID=A0A2N7X5D9_9BURK|nr:hypothetical protein [Trinickia symbiotica]PMS36976.1 hypothetical protein C0Z20_09585 [Trinickia symbiotica]PPK41571.1 hypothetical protein B0G57_12853 [Trinickia symbiotica]
METEIAFPSSLALARRHADQIRRIVSAHECSDPKVIDYDDPDYELTLLVTGTERTSLFHLGGIMVDIEEQLGIQAFIVELGGFEETVARTGYRHRVFDL